MADDSAVHVGSGLAGLLARDAVLQFRPQDFGLLCPSGFRRVVIADTESAYVSVQSFGPRQRSFAHTHPDSEEWVVVLSGSGEARFGDAPIPLTPGAVVGRGSVKPHAFAAGDRALHLLSIQCPRPAERATSWDETGVATDPVACLESGRCRGCPRCGGHSAESDSSFACENCSLVFG